VGNLGEMGYFLGFEFLGAEFGGVLKRWEKMPGGV
jgi:hypothetical protein